MFADKKDDVETFWKSFEEATGETVLAKSLGRYTGGWDEYAEPLWGLAIVTSGGFRFHHFPPNDFLTSLSRIASRGQAQKEKTFFIPRETINSAELVQEKRWWKKLLGSAFPVLIIRCQINETEKEVIVEIDRYAVDLAKALTV